MIDPAHRLRRRLQHEAVDEDRGLVDLIVDPSFDLFRVDEVLGAQAGVTVDRRLDIGGAEMALRDLAEGKEPRYRRPLYALSIGGGGPGVSEKIQPGNRGDWSEEALERALVQIASRRIGKKFDGQVISSTNVRTCASKATPDNTHSAPFQYLFLSGTSFSAPAVSGIVALMLEKDPSLSNDDATFGTLGNPASWKPGSLELLLEGRPPISRVPAW
jgi:hypothetical protein